MFSLKSNSNSIVISVLMLAYWSPMNLLAATLKEQVDYCKQQLEFSQPIPAGSCISANTQHVRTGGNGLTTRLGYLPINHEVDAVFHCGSVDEQKKISSGANEMIIHNRRNGFTCFFNRHTPQGSKYQDSISFPSLDLANASQDSDADLYWKRSDGDTVTNACALCHKNSGPYFIVESAPVMAYFGLINNGHDTENGHKFKNDPTLRNDLYPRDKKIYRIANADPEKQVAENTAISNSDSSNPCGGSCHYFYTPAFTPPPPSPGFPTGFFSHENFRADEFSRLVAGGRMPPKADSSYRWMNLSTPFAPSSSPINSGDFESHLDLQAFSKDLACKIMPEYMEARAVGTDYLMSTDQLPNVIKVFNPRDGLVCKNADQGFGACWDYSVTFKCGGTWTAWQSRDTPNSGDGDTEAPPAGCNATDVAAWVSYNDRRGGTLYGYAQGGLPDRLAAFEPTGLRCLNKDQPVEDRQQIGQCSNYTVRFGCYKEVLSFTSTWAGTALTVTYPLDQTGRRNDQYGTRYAKGQGRNTSWESQNWVIEPIDNTAWVRLKNPWSNTYLGVDSQAEEAFVKPLALDPNALGEKWDMERVVGTQYVRFKNMLTNKYLTMGGKEDFAQVKSQSLNKDWLSQLWELN